MDNNRPSSFIIAKKNLTEEQIDAIRHNSELGTFLDLENAAEGWTVKENDIAIGASSLINSYDISKLLSMIGVKDADIAWNDSCWYTLPESKIVLSELFPGDVYLPEDVTWLSELKRVKK